MAVAIITEPFDVHTMAVSYGLKQFGTDVIELHPRSFAHEGGTSVELSAAGPRIRLYPSRSRAFDGSLECIWFRRVRATKVATTDGAGKLFAEQEFRELNNGLWQCLSAQHFSVNKFAAQYYGANKLQQLLVAAEVGLHVPLTLMTNQMEDVIDLCGRARGPTVYKAFAGSPIEGWPAGVRLRTTILTQEHLAAPESLQISPGIFQEYVEKDYEIRATCFGGLTFAAKLNSQSTVLGKVDWRSAEPEELKVEPVVLPQEVEGKLQRLLQKLDLVFGCVDLIVTKDGRYVFLEINQMGQFLWVERACPELRILDAFVSFLRHSHQAEVSFGATYKFEGLKYSVFLATDAYKAVAAQANWA
jgi:glutathione synthase/RimK-type ligase-like ATP-grasp enzyme